MRMEQEQKLTEDARVFAEQDAAAQRIAVNVLQVLSPIHFVTFGILLRLQEVSEHVRVTHAPKIGTITHEAEGT